MAFRGSCIEHLQVSKGSCRKQLEVSRDRKWNNFRWVKDHTWNSFRWVEDHALNIFKWVEGHAWNTFRWVEDSSSYSAKTTLNWSLSSSMVFLYIHYVLHECFFLTVLLNKQGLNLRMYKTRIRRHYTSIRRLRSITAIRWHMKTFPKNTDYKTTLIFSIRLRESTSQ